jgi:hypothetical protein
MDSVFEELLAVAYAELLFDDRLAVLFRTVPPED